MSEDYSSIGASPNERRWRSIISEYGPTFAAVVGVALLVVAANLATPRWWLGVAGWIPVGWYIARRVFALPEKDPRLTAALASVISFLIFGGYGVTSRNAFFRSLFQPSVENMIRFGISRGFLASTAIYFAAVYLGYRSLLEAAEDKLFACRSKLDDIERQDRGEARASTPATRSQTLSPETQRRLQSWERRAARGRYLRRLRESANSQNGQREG